MRAKPVELVCAITVGVTLMFLYANFLISFLARADLSQLTTIQVVIIVTQLARLAAVLAIPGMRFSRVEIAFVLFSLETFVVLGLIGVYLFTPSPVLSGLGHEIFSTWMATLFCITPPYLITWGMVDMLRNRGLSRVILPVMMEFGFLTYLLGILSQLRGGLGLGSFFDSLILTTRGDVAGGVNPLLPTTSSVLPSAAIYCALLVYASLSAGTTRVPLRVGLIFPFASAVIVSAWLSLGSSYLPNMLLSFAAPSVIIATLLWWFARR